MAPSTVATPRAAASDRKRKAEAVASSSETPVEEDAERNYHDVEKEVLECPICLEQFTPPVYQCQNGHAVCSTCRAKIRECPSCSQPVSKFIRNLLAEKIVESIVDVEEHRRSLCTFRPCPCPVPGCIHEGPKQTLSLHLQKKHQVQVLTAAEGYADWQIGPGSSDQPRFVILENSKKAELLLHREVIGGLGEILFCTSFEDHSITYNLSVVKGTHKDHNKVYTMINGASAVDIRQRNDWKKDAILCCDPQMLKGAIRICRVRTCK